MALNDKLSKKHLLEGLTYKGQTIKLLDIKDLKIPYEVQRKLNYDKAQNQK